MREARPHRRGRPALARPRSWTPRTYWTRLLLLKRERPGRVTGLVEQFLHERLDLRSVQLDALHHQVLGQRAVAELHVEARQAEGLNRRGDLLRHGLRRADANRAVGSGPVVELSARDGRPSTLGANLRHQRLVMGPE